MFDWLMYHAVASFTSGWVNGEEKRLARYQFTSTSEHLSVIRSRVPLTGDPASWF